MKSKRIETEAERRARYAAKDVTDKLGIKAGMIVRFVGKGDVELQQKVHAKVGPIMDEARAADVILYWPESSAEVMSRLKKLKQTIVPNGGIWVISAKKNKGEPYLPDFILIPLGSTAGLVDNKVCSISDTQTAMRFVIRVKDRGRE
jgi:hypothetical protein